MDQHKARNNDLQVFAIDEPCRTTARFDVARLANGNDDVVPVGASAIAQHLPFSVHTLRFFDSTSSVDGHTTMASSSIKARTTTKTRLPLLNSLYGINTVVFDESCQETCASIPEDFLSGSFKLRELEFECSPQLEEEQLDHGTREAVTAQQQRQDHHHILCCGSSGVEKKHKRRQQIFPHVTFIGDSFLRQTALHKLTLHNAFNQVEKIPVDFASVCSSLIDVTIQDSFNAAISIGGSFLNGAQRLMHVKISDSFQNCKLIGDDFCNDCEELRSFVVSRSFLKVTHIGGTFCHSSKLLFRVDFSSCFLGQLKSVGFGFFGNCTDLKIVVVSSMNGDLLADALSHGVSGQRNIERRQDAPAKRLGGAGTATTRRSSFHTTRGGATLGGRMQPTSTGANALTLQRLRNCSTIAATPSTSGGAGGRSSRSSSRPSRRPSVSVAAAPTTTVPTEANITILTVPLGWCWAIHPLCSKPCRFSILSLFTGLCFFNSKSNEQQLLPAEVAYQIATFVPAE